MHNRRKNHTCNTIHPDYLITKRPAQANARSRLGDWEGDTLYGAVGQGLIVTCVNRVSQFLRMVLLENRNQEATKDAIVRHYPVMW